MKLAFYCEGESEAESVLKFMNKLGIQSFEIKRTDAKPPPGLHGIYIHNGRNDGRVLYDFRAQANFLIEKQNFDFVIAWCDYARQSPKNWCPKQCIEELRKKTSCGNKIILFASIKCLENWLFADWETLYNILKRDKPEEKRFMEILAKIQEQTQNFGNVEDINANVFLRQLTWALHGTATKYDKIETSKAFFSKFCPDKIRGSKSFLRAIGYLKKIVTK